MYQNFRTLLFGAVLSAIGLPAAAQSLVGEVMTTDGQPLVGAQVVVPSLQRGAVTNETGFYRLDQLPPGQLLVVFRFVGFATEERLVGISEQGELTLNVTLSPVAVQFDEVVVTAEGQADAMLSRSTRSVTILDAQELEDLRGQTLGQMLAALPGVTSLSTGPSISKPVVRGLHSQRLVVLNAGVAQEGQQWGGEHAPEIDPFAPARVEVIKGAAGVEYGVGAIGGVIRLEPAELPQSAPLSGSVSAERVQQQQTVGWIGDAGGRGHCATRALVGGCRLPPAALATPVLQIT